MNDRLTLTGALLIMGAAWGITLPFTKVAVSTGHEPFGMIFWQSVLMIALLATICRVRGRGLPLGRAQMRLYVMVGLVGTILPNGASFTAAAHLPAGIMSIVLSTVPMMAFPIAMVLGLDRFSLVRMGGLLLGLAGVLLLIGPDAGLPERAVLIFVPVALAASFCYGLEGNLVALWGRAGLDPVQVLLGASVVALGLSAALTLGLGQWINPLNPWGKAEYALVASSLIHGLVYASYVWLVGRAGPVFAVQVAYPVTAFGVLWSMLLLGESYAATIWLAFGLICAGLFLVQPRPRISLAEEHGIGDDAPSAAGDVNR